MCLARGAKKCWIKNNRFQTRKLQKEILHLVLSSTGQEEPDEDGQRK